MFHRDPYETARAGKAVPRTGYLQRHHNKLFRFRLRDGQAIRYIFARRECVFLSR